MTDGLLQVRCPGVSFHVLRDPSGLYLVDAGFIGARRHLDHALARCGWENEPIRGILVTHGHLDHILNIGRIAAETGAWVAAPALDAAHYAGRPCYRGAARVTGWLEALGRPLLGFRPFVPDRLLNDGDTLDVWHGLSVVHLPGHTAGHSGFHCPKLKLLFCGDLFASYANAAHYPPEVFNSDGKQIPHSILKALDLDLAGILPNHADRATPREHLERLRRLARTFGG